MAVVKVTQFVSTSTCIWLLVSPQKLQSKTCAKLLFMILIQLLAWSVKGDYEMSVTVRSFLLLDSRCALCYGTDRTTPERMMSCCDAIRTPQCEARDCDITLSFCPISGQGLGFDGDDISTRPSGFLQCVSAYSDGFLGYNVQSGQAITYGGTGPFGDAASGLVNPVPYTGEGGWVSIS